MYGGPHVNLTILEMNMDCIIKKIPFEVKVFCKTFGLHHVNRIEKKRVSGISFL